jgi:hypothetical protein
MWPRNGHAATLEGAGAVPDAATGTQTHLRGRRGARRRNWHTDTLEGAGALIDAAAGTLNVLGAPPAQQKAADSGV